MIKKIRKFAGSTIIELIIVIVLLSIMVSSAVGIFISARKIMGQSYIQHSASLALSESNDIIVYFRNLSFDQLIVGDFYLIRNPGLGSWLIKEDLPDFDVFERYVVIENAYRDSVNGDICTGDITSCVEDEHTKKIAISILWAPDYIRSDTTTEILYITNWKQIITY